MIEDWEIQKDLLFMKSLKGSKDMFQKYFEEYVDYYDDEVLQNDNYIMYLVFSNIEEDATSFCVHMDDINMAWKDINIELAATKFFVKSLWTYLDKTIWLIAVYGQPIPGFLSSAY